MRNYLTRFASCPRSVNLAGKQRAVHLGAASFRCVGYLQLLYPPAGALRAEIVSLPTIAC